MLPRRMEHRVKPLDSSDAEAVASLHRASYDAALPWLAGRYTPEQDRFFFETLVFAQCRVWGVLDAGSLQGFIACRDGWIDQLYVRPGAQGRGIGSALIAQAKAVYPALQLWTFQRNAGAQRFYERHGFVAVESSDGSRNEEREPDRRYFWRSV